VAIDKQTRRRYLSLLLGPLFLSSAAYLYNLTGMGRRSYHNWQFEHRTRIGNLPLSLSDYYFVAAIFCAVCGVIYFVLSNVARRPLEILFGYAHFCVSIVTVALVASYIAVTVAADPLEPIPRRYWNPFLLAQILFALYIAWAMFSPPPED
jgi:energy-coupling factor transporter transmembrane protein EcfT